MKTIIIEDEPKSMQVLATLIKKNCPELSVIGMAKNVKEGVEMIKKLQPGLVVLDITMPDGSGFDLLEQVGDSRFEIIFATASDKFAIKAIRYSACDYLLKPIDADELKAAVNRVISKKNQEPNMKNLDFLIQQLKEKEEYFHKITLPTGNAFEIVSMNEIVRCEADGSYTNFYLTSGRRLMISLGLKHYEDLLPENIFMRIHHHHLVNVGNVTRFLKEDGGYAIMKDGSKIEVSRRKRDVFLEKLRGQK